MNIRFYATLKDMAGVEEVEMAFNGSVGELLEKLCNEYGAGFRSSILDDSGKLRKYIKLVVNGRNIEHLEGFRTELRDDDTVALFPPIAGGAQTRPVFGVVPHPERAVLPGSGTSPATKAAVVFGVVSDPVSAKGGREWNGFTEST